MKTKYLLLFLITIFFALLNISNCVKETKQKKSKKPKKNKKSKKNKNKNNDNDLPSPDSIRPSHVSAELLCDSCQAIISEAVKKLGTQTKSSEVLFYLDGVCDPKRYNIYHFPPPDMKTGCEVFVGAYNDELEKVLIGRKLDLTKDDIIQDLCFKTTKVCVGVDFNNINPMDDTITIDGEPVKIADLNKKQKEEENEKKSKEKKKEGDL